MRGRVKREHGVFRESESEMKAEKEWDRGHAERWDRGRV